MTGQELGWGEQRIRMKILPHFVDYPKGELRERAEALYGTSAIVRTIKDYNSLNFWLSANPASFGLWDGKLNWLNIALGYGAGGMYGGYTNEWTDNNGVFHDRTDIERFRRFYLSLDVDLSRIKTRSAFLNSLFEIVNIIKIPAPAIELNSKGQVVFHPLY